MRKRRVWAGVTAAVLLVVGVCAVVHRAAVPKADLPPPETPPVYRIIGEWDGRVAVFLPEKEQPEQVFDTPLAVLPAEEQRRLEQGVAVADAVALAEYLEDYLG